MGKNKEIVQMTNKATEFPRVYVLTVQDEDGQLHDHFYPTNEEREIATLKEIWMFGPDSDDKEVADIYLSTLRGKGILTFECDPPLFWKDFDFEALLQAERDRSKKLIEALALYTGEGGENLPRRIAIEAIKEYQTKGE